MICSKMSTERARWVAAKVDDGENERERGTEVEEGDATGARLGRL